MRAIQIEQFGDPARVIRVVDIEEPPPPGPHEVLLSVEVSPLNKHDLLVVSGMLARPPLPHIPGAEGVARVLATGAEVDGLQVGDLVPIGGQLCLHCERNRMELVPHKRYTLLPVYLQCHFVVYLYPF